MTKFEADIYTALLDAHLIPENILVQAASESQRLNISLTNYLLDNNYIDEDRLLPIMSRILNVPFINLKESVIDDSVIKAVPVRFAWYYELMPLKIEGTKLTVAVRSPLSIRIQDEIRLSLGFHIAIVLAKKEQILELLKKHYGLGADTVDQMISRGAKKATEEIQFSVAGIEDIEKLAGDASVVKLVNQIIFDAYKKRSTDIHIEPFRGKLRLRYRIDGVLYDQNVPEDLNRFLLPILSRIKIMSNLNIVERRIPQDGRAVVKTQEQVLDLRVSFIPTPHGESVVIRILPTKMLIDLERLGLSAQDLEVFESLIRKPHGIIFVTGPTGSGKTTTLYACLKRINKNEKKIITIEDPIEYEMDDITQIQVNAEVGLTFAQGLRSVLRHDPDIMMVGEVRDMETAEIAIRVALTGHLVLSTLHTNDASTGVTRLIDIGIEPYLIASSVEAFIAQRLVRVLCPQCRIEDTSVDEKVKTDIMQRLGLASLDEVKVYKPVGCASCNFAGFYGRTAIYELLLFDKAIQHLITEKATAPEIKREAIRNGMRPLLQDGLAKVVQGITTLEEVFNVCQDLSAESRSVDKDAQTETPSAVTGSGDYTLEEDSNRAAERRIYMRAPKKIDVQFRVIEKGPGEIIKLDDKEKSVYSSSDLLKFFDDVAPTTAESEVYRSVFATTLNVSAGGLAFASQYLIPVGSKIELKVTLPGNPKSITCLAKVIRVEKDIPHCFHIGVCYLDMSVAERKSINDFVKKEHGQQGVLKMDSEATP